MKSMKKSASNKNIRETVSPTKDNLHAFNIKQDGFVNLDHPGVKKIIDRVLAKLDGIYGVNGQEKACLEISMEMLTSIESTSGYIMGYYTQLIQHFRGSVNVAYDIGNASHSYAVQFDIENQNTSKYFFQTSEQIKILHEQKIKDLKHVLPKLVYNMSYYDELHHRFSHLAPMQEELAKLEKKSSKQKQSSDDRYLGKLENQRLKLKIFQRTLAEDIIDFLVFRGVPVLDYCFETAQSFIMFFYQSNGQAISNLIDQMRSDKNIIPNAANHSSVEIGGRVITPIPYEKICSSVELLLQTPISWEYLHSFQKNESCSENTSFYRDVFAYQSNYQYITDQERMKMAKQISYNYIDSGSSGKNEINITSSVRKQIVDLISKNDIKLIKIDIFDVALKEITNLIKFNHHERFLESYYGKQFKNRWERINKAFGESIPIEFANTTISTESNSGPLSKFLTSPRSSKKEFKASKEFKSSKHSRSRSFSKDKKSITDKVKNAARGRLGSIERRKHSKSDSNIENLVKKQNHEEEVKHVARKKSHIEEEVIVAIPKSNSNRGHRVPQSSTLYDHIDRTRGIPMLNSVVLNKDFSPDPRTHFHPLSLSISLLAEIMLIWKLAYESDFDQKSFDMFLSRLCHMQNLNLTKLNHKEKLAFWLNTFNILSLHANLVYGPASKEFFFVAPCYLISGQVFCLAQIQNLVLCDSPPLPGTPGYPLAQFDIMDPRSTMCLSRPDPRVHFALSYGCTSNPLIKIYTESNVETSLSQSVTDYLGFSMQAKLKQQKVLLPTIFQWYKEFLGDETPLTFITPFIKNKNNRNIIMKLNSIDSGLTIVYADFDWTPRFTLAPVPYTVVEDADAITNVGVVKPENFLFISKPSLIGIAKQDCMKDIM